MRPALSLALSVLWLSGCAGPGQSLNAQGGETDALRPALAMDPLGGTLYAAHGGDDSLYKLDITTGAPTLVGPVGNALGAIGGMDFSADGQTLLLSDAGELLTTKEVSDQSPGH